MAGGQSAAASGTGPEEGDPVPMEEGIAGQTIPVHDGRAAEPLSALRYVEIDVRVVFRGFPEGSVP
jgi:hypothetical protein